MGASVLTVDVQVGFRPCARRPLESEEYRVAGEAAAEVESCLAEGGASGFVPKLELSSDAIEELVR